MRLIEVLLSATIASAIQVDNNKTASVTKPVMPDEKKAEMIAMLALAGRLMKLEQLAKHAKMLQEKTQAVPKQ